MPQIQEVQGIQRLIQTFGAEIEKEIDRIRADIQASERNRADSEAKDSLARGLEDLGVLTANGTPAEIVRMNSLIDSLGKTPNATPEVLQQLAAKNKTSFVKVAAINKALRYENILTEIRSAKIKAIEKIASGEIEPEKPIEHKFDKSTVLPAPGGASGAMGAGVSSAWTTRGV